MTAIFESDPLSVGRGLQVELVPEVSREAAEFVRRDRTIRYGFAARGGLIIRSGSREQKVEPLAAESEYRSNACWRAATTLYRKLRASNAKDPAVGGRGIPLRKGITPVRWHLGKIGDFREGVRWLKKYLEATSEGNTPRRNKAEETLAEWEKTLKD